MMRAAPPSALRAPRTAQTVNTEDRVDHKDSIATHIINPRRGTSNTKQTRLTVRRPGSTSHEVAPACSAASREGTLRIEPHCIIARRLRTVQCLGPSDRAIRSWSDSICASTHGSDELSLHMCSTPSTLCSTCRSHARPLKPPEPSLRGITSASPKLLWQAEQRQK